jgi:hypothetical protein
MRTLIKDSWREAMEAASIWQEMNLLGKLTFGWWMAPLAFICCFIVVFFMDGMNHLFFK